MTMTEQSPKLSGRARAAALATVLLMMLLVPQAASAQTVLLSGANFEDVRNCDITRRLPGC